MLSQNPRIGFIGFGELGVNFAIGLKEAGVKWIGAYDKAVTGSQGEALRRKAQQAGVDLKFGLKELAADAELLISAVWGNASLDVAIEIADLIKPGQMMGDINNTAPAVKKRSAELINARGARYVDISLFENPVLTKHRGYIYVSGDGAEEFKAVMSRYGMNIEVLPGEAGKATIIKTLFKLYFTSVQAISLELAVALIKTGVSFETLLPLVNRALSTMPREKELAWQMIRGALHAKRKATEMPEILEAMREWQMEPLIMEAAGKRLEIIGRYGLNEYLPDNLSPWDYQAILDALQKASQDKNIALK